MSPFAIELGLGAVMLAVFGATLAARGTDRRWIAWLATVGVLAVGIVSALAKPTPPALFGMFVQDALAIFAKRLFLTAVYVLRVVKQIFWGPPSPHFHDLVDARGPEWVALVVLVAVLVLFGMVPGLAIAPVDTATVPLLARIVNP